MNGQPPYNLNDPFGISQSQGDYSNQLFINQSAPYLAPFNVQPMFYGMGADAQQQVDSMMTLQQRQQQLFQAAFPTQASLMSQAQTSANFLQSQQQVPRQLASVSIPQHQQLQSSHQPQQLYASGIQFPLQQPNSVAMMSNLSALQASRQPQASQQQQNQQQQLYQQQQTQQAFYMQQQQQPISSPLPPSVAQQQQRTMQPHQLQSAHQLGQQQQEQPSNLSRHQLTNSTLAAVADRSCGGEVGTSNRSRPPPQIPAAVETGTSPPARAVLTNNQVENERILREQAELELREKQRLDEHERHRIQEELRRRKENAKEFAENLQEKLKCFVEPVHLSCCHTLSKVSNFLPFPAECASTSSMLPCFDAQRIPAVLSNTDYQLAHYLAKVLTAVDEPAAQICLQQEDQEMQQIEGSTLAPLVEAVLSSDAGAFSISAHAPSPSMPQSYQLNDDEMERAFDKDIQEMVAQVSAGEDMFSELLGGASSGGGDKSRHLGGAQASIGKQPKTGAVRRKRDMIGSLYDSLTGYFDPAAKSRRHRAARGIYSEEDDEESEGERNADRSSSKGRGQPDKGDDEDEEVGRFFERRGRKRARPSMSEENRPTTPTDMIEQRTLEWNEKQRQKQEKDKKRKQQEGAEDCWNHDVMAENESFLKFTSIIEQIFDQVAEMDLSQYEGEELPIDRTQLEELRTEAQKLKSWRRLNKVNVDRLVRLLTVLERIIRDVLSDEGSLRVPVGLDDADETSDEAAYRELMDERLIRSVDAACIALTIMTGVKMPKQVFIEDAIERAIQLAKQYLQHIIYPAVDASQGKTQLKGRTREMGVKRRRGGRFTPGVSTLYMRLVDLVDCFSDLARFQTLNDSVMLQFSTLASPPFFVDGIPEMQVVSVKLLSAVFSKCQFLRKNIIFDLLNSLHRLPSTRNGENCFRLGNMEISNFTVLILQLVQSVVKLPQLHSKKAHTEDTDEVVFEGLGPIDDKVVLDSYEEAKLTAALFFGGFLNKCTAKSEDDYRRLFEQFLQELLTTLYRPEWPVSELLLAVLGNILVKYTRTKSHDLSLRAACLDYLGTITARLRKDRVAAISDATDSHLNRLDLVVRSIVYDENDEKTKSVDEIDISRLSSTEKIRKLEQALIDYIVGTKSDTDVSVEYVVTFYAAEWYRETVLDVEVMKQRYSQSHATGDVTAKEIARNDKKLERIREKGRSMKEFILSLIDRKHIKRRAQIISKTLNTMLDCDAIWVVKYLASKKELSQSFDIYLNKILEGFNPDLFPPTIRARAMKCLSQIVEADHQTLKIPEVNKIVQDRLIDANAVVREATFELIGKYLVARPDLLDSYFAILMSRIKDTSTAVRKRVIRILKEVAEKQPKLDKRPTILARICQRINDEDTVKKLCIETFQTLWFQPLKETEKMELEERIELLVDTVDVCMNEGSVEQFEAMITSILKNSTDRLAFHASKQMVDALVDNVLSLDSKIAEDGKISVTAEKVDETQLNAEKLNRSRLIASLTALSVFAKAKPEFLIRHAEVFLPYLSMTASNQTEWRVLNQMISMLEQIVPLIEHPSEAMLKMLDQRLNELVKDGGMIIIATAISCMSAVHAKFKRVKPGICSLFLQYLKYLTILKNGREDPSADDKRPFVLRFLYTLGLMARYFDFDHLLRNNPETNSAYLQHCGPSSSPQKEAPNERAGSEEHSEATPLRESVFSVLHFFSQNQYSKIAQNALLALGQFGAGYPSILAKPDLKSTYLSLLAADSKEVALKSQVLRNLSCFLRAEEERALAKNAELRKEREAKGETEDLKEMELGSSGLSSTVIQVYWESVLRSFFHYEAVVRTDAAQVIWQTLEQGLVTPGSSIPTLIAMTTDSHSGTRTRIENLVKEIDAKYPGMVSMKGVFGMRLAFKLQKQLHQSGQPIRGIRAYEGGVDSLPKTSNEAQSLLNGLYSNLRSKRDNRRNFVTATLRLFSENCKEKPNADELAFIADNLAHFPYQALDEPLFIINQAESIISLAGQNILSALKRRGMASDEDDDYSLEAVYARLPSERSQLKELRKNSQACFLLLQIKAYLMKVYALKEEKVKEYSPSEPMKVYERALNRRNIAAFCPDLNIAAVCSDEEGIVQGDARMRLASHFQTFFKMLLSLDTRIDDDETAVEDVGNDTVDSQMEVEEEGEASGIISDPSMSTKEPVHDRASPGM